MSHSSRVGSVLFVSFVALAVMMGAESTAQVTTNPYRAVYGWEKLPEGRQMGVPSGIYPDRDGEHIWILARCGADNCAGSDLDPILKFDGDGNLVKSFGAGLFGWPHGFFVDHEGNVWVTEGSPAGEPRGEAGFKLGKGHQVFKFSPDGELLMTLGTAGVHGDGPNHFNGPSHVMVAPNGDIWVTDGHRGGNNRLVKFSKDGKFIQQWGGGVGSASAERGLFNDPHHLAMDSQGRIFVSDRGNNRIQIFDQEGNLLEVWTQFGRPSAIFIDDQDTIYVTDGTSTAVRPGADGTPGANNPGYERGIRIGDARTGWVTAFIPEVEIFAGDGRPRGVAVEFLGVDAEGNIYVGEVQSQRLVKYVRVRR